MHNLGTVWVVISASEAQKRLVSFIDSGYLIEATSFSYALQGLIDKMKSFVQQYGGSIPLHMYERIVMQIPSSAAEQIPSIIKGYSEALNNKISVGMGLTMEEASIAAKKSSRTGKIELHDPKNDYHYEESFIKSSNSPRKLTEGVVLPPNIFDPTTPDDDQYQYKSTSDKTDTKIPTIEESQQGEMKLIQGITAQMGLKEVQQQQQQMQQQMQQQQAQQQPPGDLLESLNGGPVDGHTPDDQGDEKNNSDQKTDKVPGSEDKDKDKATKELTEEVEDAESAASDDKIAMHLDKIKGQIPQIMGLADKDPKAFKQTMDMINKLIQLAHSRSKTTKKSETRENLEELIKAINRRAASSKPLSNGVRYPVGTRLGRYKKVLVEGMEKWREMSSGIVQGKGGAISIRESNKESTDNDRDGSQVK